MDFPPPRSLGSADERSDGEIIAASVETPAAFGDIHERHHRSLFAYVARRVGVDEAGDVTAEVFIRAFSIRERYDTTKTDCRPWLYAIAGNVLGDRFRRVSRRDRAHAAVWLAGDVSESADADDRMAAQRVRDRLDAALSKLSSADRETLLLYALEGLTYTEIGRILGIPAGTVGSRITRARRRILEEIPDLEQIAGWEVPPGYEDGS